MSLCRPIIVLGTERSGTSAYAEMVHAWGAHAGDPGDLPAADQLNPRGRWEYLPLWGLLAEIGGFAAGATWWAEDFPAQVAAKAADPQIADRARALVAHGGTWPAMAVEGPGAVSLPRLLAAVLARAGLPGHGPPPGGHRGVLESVPAPPAAAARHRWNATCCAGST